MCRCQAYRFTGGRVAPATGAYKHEHHPFQIVFDARDPYTPQAPLNGRFVSLGDVAVLEAGSVVDTIGFITRIRSTVVASEYRLLLRLSNYSLTYAHALLVQPFLL